jgi:hypothetical protein
VFFIQFRFLIFFLVVFSVHWLLRSNTARKVWLLAASHFFYACLFVGGPESASAEKFPPFTFYERLVTGQSLPTGWWFPFVRVLGQHDHGFRGGTCSGPDDVCANLGVLGFFTYANSIIYFQFDFGPAAEPETGRRVKATWPAFAVSY